MREFFLMAAMPHRVGTGLQVLAPKGSDRQVVIVIETDHSFEFDHNLVV